MRFHKMALTLSPLLVTTALTAGAAPTLDTPPDQANVSSVPDLFAEPGTPILPARQPDTVVAKVNGNPLFHKNVEIEMQALRRQLGRSMSPTELEAQQSKIAEWAMDAAVLKILLVEQLEQQKITNTLEELEAAIDKVRASLPEGVTFEDFLIQEGREETEVRETMAMDIRLEKLLNRVMEVAPPPTEEQVLGEYMKNKEQYNVPERVQARHILVSVEKGSSAEVKAEKLKRAETILEKAQAGDDFEALAKEFSDGPTAEKGGDLGFLSRGTTVPPFEEAIFSREPGTIGAIVETQFGYHIIETLAKEPARQLTLEEVQPTLVNHLTSIERQNTLQKYFSELKSKADITFPEE